MGLASALLKGDDDRHRDDRYNTRPPKKSVFSDFFD